MALKSLSTGKTYKNVYTILEKVKKGEIATHYNKENNLFNKLDFYKKPDLIKPHMHYLDERKLENIVDDYIYRNETDFKKSLNTIANSSKFKALDSTKKPDEKKFKEAFHKNYDKFPKHISRDIYKMFYYKIDNLDFEERTDKNHVKYKFLEKANNPVAKIMAETSALKSAIYTRSIMMYYIMKLTEMEFVDPDKKDDLNNGINGEGDNDAMDNILKDMMNGKSDNGLLDKMIDNASQICKDIDNNIPDDIQDKMFNESVSSTGAGKISPDYLKKIATKLESLNFSMEGLKEKIKKIMDKSLSYFSAKKVTILDDLFNTDNIANLDDYVSLHPKLRKILVEDITIKDHKLIGKIDVYIDISGSMDSGCGTFNTQGDYITKIDFAKSFTAKLKSMDMLNNVKLFNTKIYPCNNDIISIAMIHCDGGTSLDTVVKDIIINNTNAIVITDAEDRCNVYSDKAYFVGVAGSKFNNFTNEYLNNDQCIVFDGKSVMKVDKKGYVIKN